jgi:D-alanyl-D-alanine carboxypeptidase
MTRLGLPIAVGRYGAAMTSARCPQRIAGLAACAIVVLSGCSSTSAPTPGSSATPTTITSAQTNPALKTIDPQSFQSVVERLAKELKVPGAIVSVRGPQGEVTAAVGTTKIGAQAPPTPATHFRIASNTKTMTAALIVLLAQDGKLKFSDPVSDYVPGVPNGENITVAELLKMRSGLYGYTADPGLSAVMDSDPGKRWTAQELLDIAFRHPANFAPDAEYEYSNTNYVLLGLIAEKVGGKPLANQFQERLLAPLGLTQTSLPAMDDASMPAPYSHGYMYGGSYYALADDPYPADIQAAAKAGTMQPTDYTNQNPSYATAAGGAISTSDNLATWIKALVSGKIFSADFQKQWLSSQQAEDPDNPDGQKYGYGMSYQRFGPHAAMYYHGGELPGFNSFMGYDPDNDVTLVIWTNLTLSPDSRTTAQAMLSPILDEIYTGLNLAPTPTTTPTPTPTR